MWGGPLSMLGAPQHCRPAAPLVSIHWGPVAPSKYFFFFCIYLFLAVLGLHCRLSFPLVAVWGHLILGASGCKAQALGQAGSAVVAHRTNCSTTCGIFLDQGSNLCPLHWQADS